MPQSILVVDDVVENREVLCRRLTRAGFDVIEAADGSEAIDCVSQRAIDLILLDIVMPGMGGIEALKQIRLSHSQDELPIIMVSARTEAGDIAGALALGANDYVTKPVNFEVALARLNAQLQRKFAQDQAKAATLELQVHLSKLGEVNEKLRVEIEQHARSERRMSHMARHDVLTGLGNRLAFEEILAGLLSQAAPVALLCLDLDDFKLVNDTLGHAYGDDLLREVANRIAALSQDDRTICRWGGDEFTVIMKQVTNAQEIDDFALMLMSGITRPYRIAGHEVIVACSIGIAVAPLDGADPDTLLKSADTALYQAKADGRGLHRFFEPSMNAKALARRLLELDLRRALKRNALSVCYQPIFDLKTGQLAAFEALVRWQDETRGSVPPSVFIPLAEETGLIGEIGDFVLQTACADAANWAGDISVAVNFSAMQLRCNDVVQSVAAALSFGGLDPHRLEVEITESALIRDLDKTQATLRELQNLGIRIALDDFGTGYSSLSYLRQMSFQKLKIDRAFLADLKDAKTASILKLILSLGTALGMTTTAEGVETQEQLEFLRRHGCAQVQGYLTGRPALPIDALALCQQHAKICA